MSSAVEISDAITETIHGSQWIVELGDNWDDQGSSRYDRATWERACDFLRKNSALAHRKFQRELPLPKTLPGPESSIDLHWKMSAFELLVNVPADCKEPGTFYGDDYAGLSIRGTLNTAAEVQGLVVWLLG
jgi:hypothetical protein